MTAEDVLPMVSGRWTTTVGIAERLGVKDTRPLSRALDILERDGRVIKGRWRSGGGRGRPHTWWRIQTTSQCGLPFGFVECGPDDGDRRFDCVHYETCLDTFARRTDCNGRCPDGCRSYLQERPDVSLKRLLHMATSQREVAVDYDERRVNWFGEAETEAAESADKGER